MLILLVCNCVLHTNTRARMHTPLFGWYQSAHNPANSGLIPGHLLHTAMTSVKDNRQDKYLNILTAIGEIKQYAFCQRQNAILKLSIEGGLQQIKGKDPFAHS